MWQWGRTYRESFCGVFPPPMLPKPLREARLASSFLPTDFVVCTWSSLSAYTCLSCTYFCLLPFQCSLNLYEKRTCPGCVKHVFLYDAVWSEAMCLTCVLRYHGNFDWFVCVWVYVSVSEWERQTHTETRGGGGRGDKISEVDWWLREPPFPPKQPHH